ncbi:MAG: CCA tRNA nucleotidyltransferase [Phormidesmis sp.]
MSPFLPETWPFSIDLLPAGAYLVGGSVRDRLLNRQSAYLDLDFVLPSRAIETAAKIARAGNAGFVVLDDARQIARIVFDQVTVDIAQQQGASLEDDLRRRDFTINAIAYNPHHQTLVDPLNGKTDIATHTLRMVSSQNLAEDPLRLMRAYRQAAQLGFTLSADTEAAIQTLAPQLQSVSIERIRSELDGLLSISAGTAQLSAILKNQLLQFCLPHFTVESIEQIAAIDGAIAQFKTVMPAYAQQLTGWHKSVPAGCYRSWIKAAKLSRLLSAQPKAAQAELVALKYNRSEIQVVLTLLKIQPYIETLLSGPLSRAQQFFLFKTSGHNFPAVSLLALSQGVELATVQPLIAKFSEAEDDIAHARSLITGTVLMQRLGIQPGPEIGKWLNAVEQAQAEGIIDDQESAIAWVEQQNLQL